VLLVRTSARPSLEAARPKGLASQNSAFRIRRIPHVLGVYFYVSRRSVEEEKNLRLTSACLSSHRT
jgi:hypothetical protein